MNRRFVLFVDTKMIRSNWILIKIDLLKMDCEGAEYYLLADKRFLLHLQPKEIQMEYHNGANIILRYLKDSGYKAHVSSGSKVAGIIKAYQIPHFVGKK